MYSATDIFNNTQTIYRYIALAVSRKPKLYPYIEISNNNGVQKYSLLGDLSINSQLINDTEIGDPVYDLSLVLKYDTNIANNQKIICEALKMPPFVKSRTKNYVKFKLEATNYLDVSLDNAYINVEYETINSINIYTTNKIYFYARDITQSDPTEQINLLEYHLNFIDRTPPRVLPLINRNFTNVYDLSYPLLSMTSIIDLSLNINSYNNFNNLYNTYEKFYKQSSNLLYIQLFDPGINIKDIVNGQVDYIDSSFQSIDHSFNSTDISINYYNMDGSLIDVCNILFDGCSNNFIRTYKQHYKVKDNQDNYNNDISRNIRVQRFPPFINLNYQSDCCNNKYITYYHKKFEKYNEIKGYVIDYFEGLAISFENVKITKYLNENSIGTYTIKYDVSNSVNLFNNNSIRNVNVINTFPLIQNSTYKFSDILNFKFPDLSNSSYNKYSLYNGTYNFDVSQNMAFNIITHEYDICNGYYDISNVVSIISESSFNNTITNKKFYYNNVRLTISGDFNRLSIELSNNYVNPKILFVYDNQNTYVNWHDVLNNNENNVVIDVSYIVSISGLNDPTTSPYFYFDTNINTRDLHLSIGNYRFYQLGYVNFHNPIKFSITKDGTHNGGIEYTKNVFKRNLPGVSILNRNSNSNYTQINIDATTPSTLYYYCENFPNMGGKILIKNNIIISKQLITLNNYIIDSDTEVLIFDTSYINRINDDVLKDRVILTQKFKIIGGDTSFVNITCITQRNIQHNMLYNIKQLPHKLIIRKHQNLEDRNDNDISFVENKFAIMQNNVENYLVANNGASFNFSNTYINLFKYEFESSLNIFKREIDPLLNVYDEDIRPIFYNYKNYNYLANNANNELLYEILNYSDFFRKNHLLTDTLLVKNFEYKVSEFFFVKNSKLLNLDIANAYIFNDKLLAPRIVISNITSNYITFTLEIYYNTKNNWYLSNAEKSTNKETLFGTYEYIIYNDSLTQILKPGSSPARRNFVTFYNGSITITSDIIYSYNVELSANFYDTRIISNMQNTDLSNTVFLSIKDNSDNKSVCGLTKRNLYNNVFFDENQRLIFHKFSAETIVNYQVNNQELTIHDTLKDGTNSDNYLIDISKNKNDIYNFFNDRPLNFNTLRDLSQNEEYNVYIAFKIYNVLETSNNYMSLFDIDPIYLNNIPLIRSGYIYREYSQYLFNSYNTGLNTINDISYNDISNSLSTHSYIIDFNDYFDFNIYKETLTANNLVSTEYININKLQYTLVDLSSSIPFNLYDLSASQSIIFDATNLNALLALRNKIVPLYFKIRYMVNVFQIYYSNINNQVSIIIKDDDSINYYINLLTPDPSNLIANYYTNNVSIYKLNTLYKEIFDNTQLLILKYDTVINNTYFIRHDYLVNISGFLNMIIDFNYININYLDNIIVLLENNVETILNDLVIYNGANNITNLLTLNKLTTNIVLNANILTYTDISYLDYCFKTFYILNNDLDLMRKEIAVRDYNYGISFESYKNVMASNTTSYSQYRYKNLYTLNNLDAARLYADIKNNFLLLNSNFSLDYYNVLYNYANVINYYTPIPIGTNNTIAFQAYNDASINSYETLYTNVTNLYNIITRVFEIVNNDYDINNKPTLHVNKSYDFFGSTLLINSYYSNSISMKLNVKYKKSLYQSIDLSYIYLDITIPDLTPPTIIFNNSSDICFNENIFNNADDVNNLITTKLVNDLSFVDLNQQYQITSANGRYYESSGSNFILRTINNNSLLEIDFTNARNINFNGAQFTTLTINYIIVDNANNRNIIRRTVTLINDNIEPLFFYKKNVYYVSNSNIPPFIISDTITENEFITSLRNAVVILNPRIHELVPNLFSLQEPPRDLSFISIDNIQIVSIENNVEILILTYNQTNIGPLITYSGATITNFISFINTIDENLYIKYISSTQIYPIQGIFKIKLNITRKEVIISVEITDTHCCYPKVEYKPLQDSYKLGSQNTTAMRLAKYIINRHI